MEGKVVMSKCLLIVGSKQYGEYAKEIAEAMGCFEKVSFLDDDREDSVGKMEDIESFYGEYKYAIAACDDGQERVELTKRLEEALYMIPSLVHPQCSISPSAGLLKGCIVEPGVIIESQSTIGVATIIGANSVVEHNCFIGDESLLKAGTIVRANTAATMGTVTEYGSVLFTPLEK